jgi:DNA modification methylase
MTTMREPTLHSHTHCQAAHANAKTQAWQRVCLFQRTTKTTDKPTDEEEHRTDNRRLAQWRVKWLIEYSTSHQLFGVLPVLCSEIRHCANRQNENWTKEAKRVLKPTGTIYVFMGFRFISYMYQILEKKQNLNFNNSICNSKVWIPK